MSSQPIPVQITDSDRARARRIAESLGVTEAGLWTDIIREGLQRTEEMARFQALRDRNVSPEEGLRILALVPDVEPEPYDRLPEELQRKK